MAYKEEIIIDIIENGLDLANNKLKDLRKNTDQASEGHRNLGNSVLENGGAMGLLNDATGGLAMSIKDGVESLALFTKGSTLATTAQKMYTAVVGVSTGGMKLFKLALVATGIGALVVGIGLLIANFDKVKKVVLNAIPGLAKVGEIFSSLVDMVTDFVGATSDASRALDAMVAKSAESLKRNEHFLEANGDKFDQYTQKKLQANIEYNKKVVELAKEFEDGEIKSQAELDIKLSEFREKANRQILKADSDRNEEQEKKAKEISDKLADKAKQEADRQKSINDKAIEAEKARKQAIANIQKDYSDKLLDLDAKTDQDKRDLEEKRKIAELDALKGSEDQKKEVREYYDRLEKEAIETANLEKAEIDKNKLESERQAVLDQKQWEIDNGENGFVKLEKQRELFEQQAEFDLEKLQYNIDNAEANSQAQLDAQISYNARKQELDNDIVTNEKAQAEERKRVEQSVADAKREILMGSLSAGKDAIGLAAGLATKNKGIQKGALIATSALSIAEIIAGTNAGAAKEVASKGVIGLGTSALLYAKGAISIGAVLASTAKGLQGINAGGGGGDSGGGSLGGGGATSAPPAPSFNLVQGTGANQIAASIAGQNAPIQAYVVSSNVTTAQSADRNIIENSKF